MMQCLPHKLLSLLLCKHIDVNCNKCNLYSNIHPVTPNMKLLLIKAKNYTSSQNTGGSNSITL